jgi:hypothetical protein
LALFSVLRAFRTDGQTCLGYSYVYDVTLLSSPHQLIRFLIGTDHGIRNMMRIDTRMFQRFILVLCRASNRAHDSSDGEFNRKIFSSAGEDFEARMGLQTCLIVWLTFTELSLVASTNEILLSDVRVISMHCISCRKNTRAVYKHLSLTSLINCTEFSLHVIYRFQHVRRTASKRYRNSGSISSTCRRLP